MTSPTYLRAPAALFLAAACLATEARATLLVYEGFTGYTAGALEAQKPNANTVGLDKNVGYYDGAATSRAGGYTFTPAGLTLGSLATSGGALAYTSSTNVIGADITLGTSPFTGTLWTSYLVQISTRGSTASDGVVMRVGDSPNDVNDIRYNTWADSRGTSSTGATTSPNVAVTYAASTPTNTAASLALGSTYIIIGRFTGVGTTSGAATVWALTESQFASFIGAGGNEAALAGTSVTATATHTNASGTRNFITTDALALITAGGTGTIDEIRFGSALTDVTPTAAIPEPSAAAALAGLGALFAASRLRRRR